MYSVLSSTQQNTLTPQEYFIALLAKLKAIYKDKISKILGELPADTSEQVKELMQEKEKKFDEAKILIWEAVTDFGQKLNISQQWEKLRIIHKFYHTLKRFLKDSQIDEEKLSLLYYLANSYLELLRKIDNSLGDLLVTKNEQYLNFRMRFLAEIRGNFSSAYFPLSEYFFCFIYQIELAQVVDALISNATDNSALKDRYAFVKQQIIGLLSIFEEKRSTLPRIKKNLHNDVNWKGFKENIQPIINALLVEIKQLKEVTEAGLEEDLLSSFQMLADSLRKEISDLAFDYNGLLGESENLEERMAVNFVNECAKEFEGSFRQYDLIQLRKFLQKCPEEDFSNLKHMLPPGATQHDLTLEQVASLPIKFTLKEIEEICKICEEQLKSANALTLLSKKASDITQFFPAVLEGITTAVTGLTTKAQDFKASIL